MENGKNQLLKCHLFMTNKSTTINQSSFGRKFPTENPDSFSNSRKSKYTTNSKLTKSSLFKSLSGFNVRKQQQILNQLNLQIQLLQDSYFNLGHLANHVKRQLSDSFMDLANTIEELVCMQNR